ncbi:MAG: 50S ribosomal protein L32 [Candidatus Omnitrophica bacterium]|nr:50S ribosomal protein L32 [Candidatus Omnitrophota bacterium]MDD5429809.1 50S ribosomal protein L32 [Candidatus Omnitrophota bacterium]
MAHPKRKHSRARGRKRRTHQKLTSPSLTKCNQCSRLKPAHMVCPFCGYYAGREIIEIKPKESKRKK